MRETHRVAVNTWIRESGVFDGVADFDAALRDLEIPTQMHAVDDCGDGLHPSDGGYCKMGDAIDLAQKAQWHWWTVGTGGHRLQNKF